MTRSQRFLEGMLCGIVGAVVALAMTGVFSTQHGSVSISPNVPTPSVTKSPYVYPTDKDGITLVEPGEGEDWSDTDKMMQDECNKPARVSLTRHYHETPAQCFDRIVYGTTS